jgi:ABC-2 type transport system ATP-binding protein
MKDAPVIEAMHLHKAFGTTVALEDLSLTLRPNEILGLLGVNGAGKPPPSISYSD